jgi:hypothetical protein
MLFEPPYAAATVSDPATGIAAALELVSHLPMLFGVVYAFNARHFRLATAGLASLIVSLLYHACRSSMMCLDVPVGTWRIADHTCVLWLVAQVGLHLLLGSLTGPGGRGFYSVLGIAAFPVGFIAVLFYPYSLLSGLIMALFLVVAGAVRLALLLCDTQPDEVEPQGETSDQLTLIYLLIALCSMALGGVLYTFGDGSPAGNSAVDAVSHILWHCASGVALFAASASVSYRMEAALRSRFLNVR